MFLGSFLILNSGNRTKSQTPETMQNSSRDRATQILKKKTSKKLVRNLQRTNEKLAKN